VSKGFLTRVKRSKPAEIGMIDMRLQSLRC